MYFVLSSRLKTVVAINYIGHLNCSFEAIFETPFNTLYKIDLQHLKDHKVIILLKGSSSFNTTNIRIYQDSDSILRYLNSKVFVPERKTDLTINNVREMVINSIYNKSDYSMFNDLQKEIYYITKAMDTTSSGYQITSLL